MNMDKAREMLRDMCPDCRAEFVECSRCDEGCLCPNGCPDFDHWDCNN